MRSCCGCAAAALNAERQDGPHAHQVSLAAGGDELIVAGVPVANDTGLPGGPVSSLELPSPSCVLAW